MGLCGLDRLFCFMIVQELQLFVKALMQVVGRDKLWLEIKTLAESNLMPLDRLASKLLNLSIWQFTSTAATAAATATTTTTATTVSTTTTTTTTTRQE